MFLTLNDNRAKVTFLLNVGNTSSVFRDGVLEFTYHHSFIKFIGPPSYLKVTLEFSPNLIVNGAVEDIMDNVLHLTNTTGTEMMFNRELKKYSFKIGFICRRKGAQGSTGT